jgi:hypothetical protein
MILELWTQRTQERSRFEMQSVDDFHVSQAEFGNPRSKQLLVRLNSVVLDANAVPAFGYSQIPLAMYRALV